MRHNKNKNRRVEISLEKASPEEKSPLQDLAEVSPKEAQVETVKLYDVNEHPVTVAVDEVEGYVARGYRKVLPKK